MRTGLMQFQASQTVACVVVTQLALERQQSGVLGK